MAAFDTTRPSAVLSAGRFSQFFAEVFGAFAAWNDSRVTRDALSKLSARELDDIGLTRGDINDVIARTTR